MNNSILNDNRFKYLVGISALLMLSVSMYFSVKGISALFSGQRTTAMILAGSLEFAKIIVTAYLTRNWRTINKVIRTYFVIATVVLILISSAGIFANLTDAYQATSLKNQAALVETNSLTSEELSLKERKDDLQLEINSITKETALIRSAIGRNDNQVANLYKQMKLDSTVTWVGSIWEFKKQNNLYKEEINTLRTSKNAARTEIIEIDNKLKDVWNNMIIDKTSDKTADVGPLQKLSILFKVDMDTLVKYFIFVIIIVFDPLGVLLIVAYNIMAIQSQPKKRKKKKKKNVQVTEPVIELAKPKIVKINKPSPIKSGADIRRY